MLRRLFVSAALFIPVIISMPQAKAAETITLLDRGEPYDSMVAHNGVFWIGQSRLQFAVNYRLEAYTADGKLIDIAPMSHSISTMKIKDQGMIMITGINPQSHLSEYTVASLQNGKIKLQTTEIAVNGFITFWIASIGSKHFFGDIGGNPEDTNNPGPAQTIFYSTHSQPTYLTTRLSMPLSGAKIGNKLLVVSSEGYGQDKSRILEIDVDTMIKRVVIASNTARYRGLTNIPGTNDIITSASAESKVQVIDTASGTVRREFQTKGLPRSFDMTGHCLVVGNEDTNVVEIFDMNNTSEKPAFAAEINMPPEEFSGITRVAVDPISGTIFARASWACNPFIEPCDYDYNRVVTLGLETAQRVKALCH
jgi:hypothetical protein